MAPNRHQRRARAARAHRGQSSHSASAGRAASSPRLIGRVGLGLGGLACMALALAVLLTPHGAHTARGLFFLLILGGALLVLAFRPA